MRRAVLFIDGGYLAKVSKSFGMSKLDFLALSEMLCKERDDDNDDDRLRTYYYYCMPFQGTSPSAEESSDMAGWINSSKPRQRFLNSR